jgi:hypothetical protein
MGFSDPDIGITQAESLIYENLNTRLELLREEISTFITKLNSLSKQQNQGFSWEEANTFFKEYQQFYKNSIWSDLFTINEEGLLVLKNFDRIIQELYDGKISELNSINEEILSVKNNPNGKAFINFGKEMLIKDKNGQNTTYTGI